MAEKPLISVSIVSHRDKTNIAHLLESLHQQEPFASNFQVILTDNLGNDLPDFQPMTWGSLKILRNQKPRGFAYNHNRAFELAQGRYFAVLNPDLRLEQPVFEPLISKIKLHQADLVAPKIIDGEGNQQDSYRNLPTPGELVRRRLPGYHFEAPALDADGLARPDWIAAMFWLMPSETYRALNGMDEKFKLYLEDVDFCTRARLRGMKIIVDTSLQVKHDAQRSSRRNIHYLWLHMKSAFQFFTSPVYRQARGK